MSDAKHTPGEWRVAAGDPRVIVDSRGREIARAQDGFFLHSSESPAYPEWEREQSARNARLIAAAPDMLAALLLAHQELDDSDALEAVCDAIEKASPGGAAFHDPAVPE